MGSVAAASALGEWRRAAAVCTSTSRNLETGKASQPDGGKCGSGISAGRLEKGLARLHVDQGESPRL